MILVRLIVSYLLKAIGVILIIGVIYYVFKGYFMINVSGEVARDGWGRVLYSPPAIVRIVWSDMQWPGIKYFGLDLLVFWGSFAIGYALIKVSNYLQEK